MALTDCWSWWQTSQCILKTRRNDLVSDSLCSNSLFLWKLCRYESAKQVHARAVPLNGSYFENLFVHYMPRSQDWYKSDYNAHYARPVKYYTLEDLQAADKELEEMIKKEQQQYEDMTKSTNFMLWHYSTWQDHPLNLTRSSTQPDKILHSTWQDPPHVSKKFESPIIYRTERKKDS